MRSLQQRLEQLVAVHRQLLRKYASLELENAEARKKLALRDERIKQLEVNTRMLAGNMRTQVFCVDLPARRLPHAGTGRDEVQAEDHIV